MSDRDAALALYEMARIMLPNDAQSYLDGRVGEGFIVRRAVNATADMKLCLEWLGELGIPVPTREQSAAWVRGELERIGMSRNVYSKGIEDV